MRAVGIATIGDVESLEAVPLVDRGLPDSVLGAIEAGRAVCEGRDALVFMPDATRPEQVVRYSYAALIEAIEQVAGGLAPLDAGPPTVSIVLPNLPEMHVALWAAQTVGRANPINPLLEAPAIAEIVHAAGASVVVTLAPMPGQDLFERVVEATARVPSVTVLVLVEPGGRSGGDEAASTIVRVSAPRLRVVTFATLMASPPVHAGRRRGGDDVAALFHTGGTTGVPKIAQLTHANQVFTAWAANANRTMERNRTIFGGLPLFHVNGALVTGLVSWLTGATVLLGPPQGFRAPGLIENFWAIVEHHRVGAMSAVPTVYAMLAAQPVGDRDIASLEFCVCGAAPLPVATLRRFEEVTGAAILEGYGLTEGSCVSTINPGYGERRAGSVGLRAPYQRIAAVEERNGVHQRVAGGTSGAIAIAGPNVFAGYLRAEDDAGAWIALDGGRWYHTGDLGRLDEEGYLWLTGRQKDVIIRGGHNIDPAVIESALARHPDVRSVAAIGSPDPRLGEVPVAYVELRDGAAVDAETLEAFAREHVGERAAVPRRIIIVPGMPLTAIGKIYKPELKRAEAERVVNAALVECFGAGVRAAVTIEPRRGLVGSVLGLDGERGFYATKDPFEILALHNIHEASNPKRGS